MQCRVPVGKYEFLIEEDTQADMFAAIVSAEEVFGQGKCEACGNTDVKLNRRIVEDNSFYEVVCQNPKCKAKLAMSQNKKGGGLYPNRRNKEGAIVGKWGWAKYEPKKEDGAPVT